MNNIKMIDLFGKRYIFFALSICIFFAGFIGFLVNGVQLDIQFQGGTVMKILMGDDKFDTLKIEDAISKSIGKSVKAQKEATYNPDNAADKIDILRLKVAKEDTLSGEEINKVVDTLKNDFNVKAGAQMQVQSVEPFMGKEMLNKGILAVVIASVLIVIYVWYRFSTMSGLSAAVFANVALLHDALVMLAFYLIFKFPLNDSFLAAVLTILGYSINDTIVIYDRIRENTRIMKKMPYSQLVNTSVIQTMARTINTTLTVMICIITVLVFASINNIQSIKEFALPMTVGLISGTYSTVFVASPLWAMWQQHKLDKLAKVRAAKAN